MYKKDEVYSEAVSIVEKYILSNMTDIFKHSTFAKNVFYKYKFNKDEKLKKLIKGNRKQGKIDLRKQLAPEIETVKQKALDIITETGTDAKGNTYRKNAIIYRIDFLCVKLHISTATFYDYGLNKDIDIRTELDTNRETLKIGAYSKLFNSKTPVGILTFLKLIGSEEERIRISTTYQEISKKEIETVEITLADEVKEIIANAKRNQIKKSKTG